jgi:hypothetical protein
MNEAVETQIINAEERLRLAMFASDVGTLDELLAPELIFTSHLGNSPDNFKSPMVECGFQHHH